MRNISARRRNLRNQRLQRCVTCGDEAHGWRALLPGQHRARPLPGRNKKRISRRHGEKLVINYFVAVW